VQSEGDRKLRVGCLSYLAVHRDMEGGIRNSLYRMCWDRRRGRSELKITSKKAALSLLRGEEVQQRPCLLGLW
jgi:hypothetical protein